MEVAVSVIIPTYNRGEVLRACLEALSKQKYNDTWEVIVVDDGGATDLNPLIYDFQDSLNVQLIKQKNQGPAKARNYAASIANGKYLAFLDDDCLPNSNWLEQLIVKADKSIMIGGKTINQLKKNNYSEASQFLVSFLIDIWNNTPWWFFTSNNFLVTKSDFEKVGGFDENYSTSAGEDRAFCAKWLHMGLSMELNETAIIQHQHHLNLIAFWRLHFKYGKSSLLYRNTLNQLGISSPPFQLSFYCNMLAYQWKSSQASFYQKTKLSVLLFLSQLATFMGVLRTSLRIRH